MTTNERLDAIRDLLRSHRLSYSSESVLQEECLRVLSAAQPDAGWTREAPLGRGCRLDLWASAWSLGIECKTKGSFGDLLSQVAGYLELDVCLGLLVVTTRNTHRGLPERILDKPVLTHWVASQGL